MSKFNWWTEQNFQLFIHLYFYIYIKKSNYLAQIGGIQKVFLLLCQGISFKMDVKGNKEAEFRENSDSTVTDVSFHCDVMWQ